MKVDSLKPVIEKLENLFSALNAKYYNNELQKPIITVSPDSTKGAYGWCTSWKAWRNQDEESDDGYYEINLCAEYLSRSFEDIAETLLHVCPVFGVIIRATKEVYVVCGDCDVEFEEE